MAGVKFLADLITKDALQFQTSAGSNAGKIEMDGDNLVLSNAVGDILFGDADSNIYIGDGINSVDILFEQNGSIRSEVGSNATLTLGSSGTTLNLYNPQLGNGMVLTSTMAINAGGSIDYTPDTGVFLKFDGQNILERTTANGGLIFGHDDGVIISGGDVSPTLKANVSLSTERVTIGAESGLQIFAFPNNDTSWSNRQRWNFSDDGKLYFGTANDTNLYRSAANTLKTDDDFIVGGGQLYISNTDTKLEEGNGNMLRVTTPSGYLEIGPANTSHAHIQTDRSNFYINTEIRVDTGVIGSYNEDLYLRRAADSANQIQIDTNGAIFSKALYVPQYIYHKDDTNTYLTFDTDRIRLVAGGTTKFDSNNTYLTSLPSHNHDDRYYTETEINNKYPVLRDGSGNDYRFSLNLGSGVGTRWYKVGTVNTGSGGMMVSGMISNHVESFATQQFDIFIQGRENNVNGAIEITGNVNVLHGGVGVYVVSGAQPGSYLNWDVYIKTTNYSMVEIDLTKTASGFNTSKSYVTTAPSGTVEIDTSTLAEGNYVVDDSTPREIYHEGHKPTLAELGAASSSSFTGTSSGTNTGDQDLSSYATQTYVGTQISNLVDSSPAALNTLNELAAALGDDASFSTTVTNSIATKLSLAGGAMTGDIDMAAGKGITFYGNGSADHGIFGKDTAGNNSDDIRINSYHNVHVNLDSNSNNTSSSTFFTIGEHGGTGAIGSNVFSVSGAGNVIASGTLSASGYNSSNWDTAHGWGNHASAGYQTSQRAISSTPTDGATTTAISSDWAFDNVKTAVPANAVFTDTVNTFDGAYNSLTSKTSGTGNYATTGKYIASDNIVSGLGSGGVALTINDGYGNANVTFNHEDGSPEQNGNSARIEVNTDSTSGAAMYFEVKSGVTSGVAVQTATAMNLYETYMEIPSQIRHLGDGNTYMQFDADRIRLVAGGTTKFDSNNTYITSQRAISSTPTDGATTTAISSDWAFDNVKTAVPASAVFTDTVNTFDGAYGSLTGTPTLFDGTYDALTGKPTLGTAAATASTAYATSAQGTRADDALPKAGGTVTGTLTVEGDTTFFFTKSADKSLSRIIPRGVGNDVDKGLFSLYAFNGTSSVEEIRLDSAGNSWIDGGSLGIGTNNPTYTLDVAGNAGFNEYLYHNGDSNTYIRLTADRVRIVAGGTTKFDSNSTYITSQRAISSTPTDGATTTAISSDWAFDNVKTAVPANAVFTDTVNTLAIGTTATTALAGNTALLAIGTTATTAMAGNTTIPTNNNELTNGAGYLTAHPNITAASSSDNSGRTYIQDITVDSNGHVTGIATATETVTNTNTTYSAGSGLDLTGTTFSIEPDLRDGITKIGKDSSNYIAIDADNNNSIDFYVSGVWVARMEADGDLHMKGDVIAFSDIFNP